MHTGRRGYAFALLAYFVVPSFAISVPVIGAGLAALAWGLRTSGTIFAMLVVIESAETSVAPRGHPQSLGSFMSNSAQSKSALTVPGMVAPGSTVSVLYCTSSNRSR